MSALMRILVIAGLATALVAPGGQSGSGVSKEAEEIMHTVHKLDLLNQLLPLVMDKEQIGKLLPAIEQARQMVKNTQKSELAEMQRMKVKLDAALKEALDKRQVPGRELMGEVANMYKVFEIKREAIARENTAKVLEAMKKVLNEGQIKAAAGALEPKLLDPSLDPKTMTQDDKLRVFVRAILLDPDAYELLIELRKRG
jgi:hypothetical protein